MAKSGKTTNGLVALSSAAILAIFAAGYDCTMPAAAKFTGRGVPRRVSNPSAVSRMEKPSGVRADAGLLPGVRSAPMRWDLEPMHAEEDRSPVAIRPSSITAVAVEALNKVK